MVDAEHQGRGYGSGAVKLLIERIKATGNARMLLTSHLKGDGNASGFYEKLGFVYTGEVIGGIDYVMKIAFSSG